MKEYEEESVGTVREKNEDDAIEDSQFVIYNNRNHSQPETLTDLDEVYQGEYLVRVISRTTTQYFVSNFLSAYLPTCCRKNERSRRTRHIYRARPRNAPKSIKSQWCDKDRQFYVSGESTMYRGKNEIYLNSLYVYLKLFSLGSQEPNPEARFVSVKNQFKFDRHESPHKS